MVNDYEKWWLEYKIKKGFYIVGESKVKLKDVRECAMFYLGKDYGIFDIFRIGFHWIFNVGKPMIRSKTKSLICSEAIAKILYDASNKKINLEEEFGIPYDFIEPMHIHKSKYIKFKESQGGKTNNG